ncbi:hypothetical protein [uncultured Megasphaera sp.]|uniref:hypothetical protein n=1 Tax=uncultured Megasphaera sp. TaxID=165188 RepID=UPI0025912FEC|nr:hypothetical protein [uncultured Megasphaera sp.]
MITITIQGKNAAEIRQELKSLLAEAAAKKKEFKPAPISVSAEVAEAVKVEKTETETAETADAAVETEPAETPVTITEVRQALKDTADAFGLEVAQDILHRYAPKLADLNADKYAALLAELQEKLG